jgi:hypothetical protein
MPCKLAVQVPVTQKSLGNTGAPMRSIPDMKGSLFSVSPATRGSQNHGPNLMITKGHTRSFRCVTTNLFSYNSVDNNAENVCGFISRFSCSLYKFVRNLSKLRSVSTSVPRPVRPTNSFDVTGKIFSKSFATVWACMPRRRSLKTS